MKLSFLQNFPVDFRSFGETMNLNWFNEVGGFASIVMHSSCVHVLDLDSFDNGDPPSRSPPLSATSSSPNYDILILAPAGQQKAVINADGVWIPRLWTEGPGFIGGMVLVKIRGGGNGSWYRGCERGDNLLPTDELCTTKDDQTRQDDIG